MNEEAKAVPIADVQRGMTVIDTGNQQLSAFTSMNGFELVQRMAKGLMTADLIPVRYQKSIGNTMIAINMAQRLNCDPLMVMQNLYVVHGNPAWSGQFVIAAINQSGMFKGPLRFVEVGKRDDMTWGFYAEATSKDGHVIKGPTVTLQLAKNEGWMAKNAKWVNMPEMMLRYRAGSWFGRTECPEILMGFQTAEEAQDRVIEIDPETGEILSDGYSQTEPRKFTEVKASATEKKVKVEAGGTVFTPKSYAEEVKDDDDHPEGEVHPFRDELAKQGWYEDSNRKFNIHGEIWNPDLHAASSKDGNPIVNADGHFRVRRGGPVAGAELETVETVDTTSDEEATNGAEENEDENTNGPGYEEEPEFIEEKTGKSTSAYDSFMEGLE